MSTAESAFKHCKHAQESVNEMGSKHVSDMSSLIRLVVNIFCSLFAIVNGTKVKNQFYLEQMLKFFFGKLVH